jgi:hypothetical protein
VYQVQVDVAALQVCNGLLECVFDVVAVSDPQLAAYKQLFPLAQPALNNLFKCIPDGLLVSVDGAGIDAPEPTLYSVPETLKGIILIQVKRAQAHCRDGVAVT